MAYTKIVVMPLEQKWNNRMISDSGDVSVYAFNISKIMTSVFGGMLTSQDKNLASKVKKGNGGDANYEKLP